MLRISIYLISILVLFWMTTKFSNYSYCVWRIVCLLCVRGFAELAVPVWQSDLYSAAVSSELPTWCRPAQRREKYVPALFQSHISRLSCLFALSRLRVAVFGGALCLLSGLTVDLFVKKSSLFFRFRDGRLQPSGNQYNRNGSCLQVRIRKPYKDFSGVIAWFCGCFTHDGVFVCLSSQRRPGSRLVLPGVSLREWPVGRSALCSGHWPGFWRAEGGAVGNIWTGQISSLLTDFKG